MNTKARIYVACLASYNAGTLYGKWIDANQSIDDIHAEISAMLRGSPEAGAEEWAVHDYEGFGEISLSEWPDLKRVSKVASMIEDHGDAFLLWYESQDGQNVDVEELEEKFLEQWQGAHDSKEAFADYLLDSTGQLSELSEWAGIIPSFEQMARFMYLQVTNCIATPKGHLNESKRCAHCPCGLGSGFGKLRLRFHTGLFL